VDMWTIGVAESLRFPRLRNGEMLGIDHIPTGTNNQAEFLILA
jgi:hypothetical protein